MSRTADNGAQPRQQFFHTERLGQVVVRAGIDAVNTCATGFMMTTDVFWGAEWVEDVHEILANLTVALIVLHVIGVVIASFEHGENLVKAMITGRKRAP